MLMNNQISFNTTGKESQYISYGIDAKTADDFRKHDDTNRGIYFTEFLSRTTANDNEIHTGRLVIGDTTISIHFADLQEITEFCQAHNIEHLNIIAMRDDPEIPY